MHDEEPRWSLPWRHRLKVWTWKVWCFWPGSGELKGSLYICFSEPSKLYVDVCLCTINLCVVYYGIVALQCTCILRIITYNICPHMCASIYICMYVWNPSACPPPQGASGVKRSRGEIDIGGFRECTHFCWRKLRKISQIFPSCHIGVYFEWLFTHTF